jgi:hypothetical protein
MHLTAIECNLPDRYRLPKEGGIVEVQYLYAILEPMESSSRLSILARYAMTSKSRNAALGS